VRRDAELRVYGHAADHDRAHGLDSASLAVEILGFLESRHGTEQLAC
jgi:transketolase